MHDLRSGTSREGSLYQAKGALAGVALTRKQIGKMQVLTRISAIDAEHFRKEGVKTAILIAEISGGKLTQEPAQARFANNRYSGSISPIFTLNAAGEPVRRVERLDLQVSDKDGQTRREETRKLERLPAS